MKWSTNRVCKRFFSAVVERFEKHQNGVSKNYNIYNLTNPFWINLGLSTFKFASNSVCVEIPCNGLDKSYVVGLDFLAMFDHVETAWGRPYVRAENSLIVVEVILVNYWDDERSKAFQTSAKDASCPCGGMCMRHLTKLHFEC
jgi:hypothetical protein